MLADIEDAIVDRVADVLGNTVKKVETLPGPWDEQALNLALRQAPGVYVYWDGGGPGRNSRRPYLNSVYRVYIVTGHASGERERRRGAAHQIGAYEILEQVVPALHGFSVADAGSLEFGRVAVLAPVSSQKKGIAVYEAEFSLQAPWPALRDAADLADFAIYSATHEVGDEDTENTESYEEIETGDES